jgi:hypothetical protein
MMVWSNYDQSIHRGVVDEEHSLARLQMLIEEGGTLKCVEEIIWNSAWIHSLTEGNTINLGKPAD